MKLLYLVESGESKFLVFDEMPDKISTKYGDDTIIGRIGGIFYDFLAKRNERREAFGGRKFDIVLDNQIENWIRCMVNDELKRRDHDFVRKACESVIRDHVLNELNIIVRSKSEKCTCENRVPSEEDKKESTDGLYIIYKDGHAEPFTGDNSKDCVRYIGLKHRYMSFAISLTEHDIVQLLDDDSREESGSGTYYERECDALFDIDGRGNTERLVARNPKLRNLLEDGEYIPSLGQLNLMAHYMDELNKAFTYVSASPLSTWYWSSTESSQAVAWYVVFSSGLTGTGNKHIGDMVRTVIDF